jgi:hypothetical protein
MTFISILQVARIFLVPFFTVLIGVYIGHFYGNRQIRKVPDLPKNSVKSVVGYIFALLAFILAFTFQIALNHYDARNSLLLEEATNT